MFKARRVWDFCYLNFNIVPIVVENPRYSIGISDFALQISGALGSRSISFDKLNFRVHRKIHLYSSSFLPRFFLHNQGPAMHDEVGITTK